MTIPSWVRIGEQCVCVDGAWKDVFETGTTGTFPKEGERFTISSFLDLGAYVVIAVSEPHVAPDYYSVDAFRPLTQLERDVDLFAGAFTGEAVSSRPELVPA